MHDVAYPNESAEYRKARNDLLRAEEELRTKVAEVAAMRAALPLGGEVPQDYTFTDLDGSTVRLSELFGDGKDSLIVYSFMYGPKMERPCPMCSSFLDSADAATPQLSQRVSFAVVATRPASDLAAWKAERGWHHMRLLSSQGSAYNRDYKGEDDKGNQWPACNVFVKRDGTVRHFWSTEQLFVDHNGEQPRHMDMVWPLWNLLDMTPTGRGANWMPSLDAPCCG